MIYCSAEQCLVCELPDGSADCLRKQAERCAAISRTANRQGVRDALLELSLDLMDEARALEKEWAMPIND